ncbi:MAG TPA: DUF418 domain-containing protein, partial [Usitatibacter sp.]|nr:DUF418 domain-containing protein [Usitatibacter sp.]
LLANLVTAFRVSPTRSYLPDDAAASLADLLVEGAIAFAIQGKAIALFSILFGAGLAIQHERFSRLGDPRPWLTRRLAALLGFGLVHLLLIWNGDILVEYALGGFLVLPLLGASNRVLARVALGCLALYLVLPMLPFSPAWPSVDTLQREYLDAMRIYGSGSFAEIRRYSFHEFLVFVPVYVTLFPETPAYLLLGVLAWRSGIARDPGSHALLLKRTAIAGVAIGALLFMLAGAALGAVTFASAGLAPIAMALGYGAALLLAMRGPRMPPLLRLFAPAGRMAFTNYIAQSLLFGWVFFGYGLGLMGRVSAATALAWGIVACAAQLALSAWWLAHFRFGPLEWLWRCLTYARSQPFRRPPTGAR